MYNRLLIAIVTTAFVEQIVITIARVATTYRAVELGLSVVWVGILISTALLGTAHLLFVISQQIQCTRCGTGPGAMERAIGNYMVANAAGQGVGPYIVALAGGSASVPPTHLLFLISVGGAVVTAGCALLTRSSGAHK